MPQQRNEAKKKNRGIRLKNGSQMLNPLAASAQMADAIVHCGPVRALMTMHELIAARFPIEPHAQAAQHDHANHAQNRRERILRAICHKHHV